MREREDEREETENVHHLIRITSHNYNYKREGGREEEREGGREGEIKQREVVKIIKIMITHN